MKNHRFYLLFLIVVLFIYSCSETDTPTLTQTQSKSEKRGVSYSFQMLDDVELLGSGVSWFYNWGNTISDDLSELVVKNNVDFIPMAWNGNYNKATIRTYKLAHPDCKYILAYNEPNLVDQANMTPAQAAAIWPDLKAFADELGLKIISPAMNYGTLSGYGDPIVWLDEFFSLIPESDIDGIAVHCYMANVNALTWYLNRFKKYNKPIWLTEFCAWESSITDENHQMMYMSDAINYLEADSTIFRYAWFIPRASGAVNSYPYMQLLTKTSPYELTPLGKVFVNMSTQDKSVYYVPGTEIPAENYSSLNVIEDLTSGAFSPTIRVRPTTDIDGNLEVYNFYAGYWVEYQIEASGKNMKQFNFRYASENAATIEIYVDQEIVATCNLSATGSESTWNNLGTPVSISQGKHIIKFRLSKGDLALNWFSFSSK